MVRDIIFGKESIQCDESNKNENNDSFILKVSIDDKNEKENEIENSEFVDTNEIDENNSEIVVNNIRVD